MRRNRSIVLLGLAAILAGSVPAAAAPLSGMTPPKDGATKGDGILSFGLAMITSCLGSREDGLAIADQPEAARWDLQAATPEERNWLHAKDNETVWTSKTLGSHLLIKEVSPTRCEVEADQLPVDDTFKAVRDILEKGRPAFHDVAQKPGYNPVVYQMEGDEKGAHFVVHMEGAEPGTPGHAYRFSLLKGWVERRPLQ